MGALAHAFLGGNLGGTFVRDTESKQQPRLVRSDYPLFDGTSDDAEKLDRRRLRSEGTASVRDIQADGDLGVITSAGLARSFESEPKQVDRHSMRAPLARVIGDRRDHAGEHRGVGLLAVSGMAQPPHEGPHAGEHRLQTQRQIGLTLRVSRDVVFDATRWFGDAMRQPGGVLYQTLTALDPVDHETLGLTSAIPYLAGPPSPPPAIPHRIASAHSTCPPRRKIESARLSDLTDEDG
jgi:hypothetical protein